MSELVRFTIEDGVGRIALARPNAINALNLEMCEAIYAEVNDWLRHDKVSTIELTGDGERGFCAGADVRELRARLLEGKPWLHFLEIEYALDMLLAGSPAPVTGHMRGITMGGGLGLTGHAHRRLVYANSVLAMPETKIGLFPDCGVLYRLSRAGAVGVHLALTGSTFTGGDAIRLGLADDSPDGDLPAPLFAPDMAWLDECYVGDDASEIVHRLERHSSHLAQQAAAELRQRSPFSVHVTLRALRRAATLQLPEVLGQDLRVAERMISVDFIEGVRALLVDRDNRPDWRWQRIEDVPSSAVDEVFSY